jgi:hypothetical protein
MRVAVFPVENLSGKSAPLGEIRRLLAGKLQALGVEVLDDALLEGAMARSRLRYTAGVEPEFAATLRQETGADAILVPALELYEETDPPRVALFARLVSTGESPALLWIDGAGLAGDDAPGLLGLGLIEEPRALLLAALDNLAGSLARRLRAGGGEAAPGPEGRKFQPRLVYRSEALEPGRRYTVAVVPFFNKSARRYAGELVALQLMRQLGNFPAFDLVEPGLVRQQLLRHRIIMQDGVSLADTETILAALNADLVLNGEVLEYRDSGGASAAPKVDFSVLFIERQSRKIVYSSYSHNAGDEGVLLFDWGRVGTAHAVAARMARAIGERLSHGPQPGPAALGRGRIVPPAP